MLINRSIPGKLRDDEQLAIALLAGLVPKSGKIVEIGPFLGRSSWIWAKNADPSVTIYSIDLWELSTDEKLIEEAKLAKQSFSIKQFKENIIDCTNVSALQGSSPDDFKYWVDAIDLYFDCRDYKDLDFSKNIEFWKRHLTKTGILCGLDYDERFPEVQQGAKEAASQTGGALRTVGTLWFILPQAIEQSQDSRIVEIVGRLRDLEAHERSLPPARPDESYVQYTERIVGGLSAFTYTLSFEPIKAVTVRRGEPIKLKGLLTNTSGVDWPTIAGGASFLKLGAELRCGSDHKKVSVDRYWFEIPVLRAGMTVPFQVVLQTKPADIGPAEITVDLVYDHICWFMQKGATPSLFRFYIQSSLRFDHVDPSIPVDDPKFWQQHVPEYNIKSGIGIQVVREQNYIVSTSQGNIPIKSMLTSYELTLLYSLARYYYSGEGEIVDLGPLLGVGTYVMARGVTENPAVVNKQRRIFSYDLFLMEHMSHFLPPSDAGNTGSVFWRFLEINRDFLDVIVPVPGDVTKMGWSGAPIEILFIDLAKTWDTNQHVLKTYFQYMIPGKSILIQQDYVHVGEPWIVLVMELLREYFDTLYFVYGASGVYRLKKPVPMEILETNIRTLPAKTVSDLFNSARSYAPNAIAEVIKCCEAIILIDRREFAAAAKLIESVDVNASDPADIAQDFTPAILPNLNATRRHFNSRRNS